MSIGAFVEKALVLSDLVGGILLPANFVSENMILLTTKRRLVYCVSMHFRALALKIIQGRAAECVTWP